MGRTIKVEDGAHKEIHVTSAIFFSPNIIKPGVWDIFTTCANLFYFCEPYTKQ